MSNGNYDRELGEISSDLKHMLGAQQTQNTHLQSLDTKVSAAFNKIDQHGKDISWLRKWCAGLTAAIGLSGMASWFLGGK